MPESSNTNPSPSSWRASRERGREAQTGSEKGTFRYREEHPEHPLLVFDYYRKRSDGSHQEVWVLAKEMETRHKQRVARNLARARARGVPPRKPAAPKEERLKKARIRREKTRQQRCKKEPKMTAEADNARWEVLALTMGVSVDSIRPK
tara:strand:- start:500 stop:946 length:447 start_codon:yes stop_codon:yes gene_type:complete